MSLIYINHVSDNQAAFAAKVTDIAKKLAIDPNWLMQVMYSESGLKPDAVNHYSGATGLIQFVSSTAAGLGTSLYALRTMSALQQLDYVYKYFVSYAGKMKSYYDVYAVVFFPAVIGKPDNWVLQTNSKSAALIAQQNPAINKNKDGVITVAEFKDYVKRTVSQTNWDIVFSSIPALVASAAPALIGIVAVVAAFFF